LPLNRRKREEGKQGKVLGNGRKKKRGKGARGGRNHSHAFSFPILNKNSPKLGTETPYD